MKNTTKLVLSNVFAFIAVITFFFLFKSLNIELGINSHLLVQSIWFLLIPQIGFVYLYWELTTNKDNKHSKKI